MNPTLSIIVPVYKVEPYLRKCVNSILAQDFNNFELILVDDGSPDNCDKICDEYAEMDNRVKVIHKKNGGLSSARNAGLDIAKGDYIGFVDGDDYIHEKMYGLLYHTIQLYSSELVICDYFSVKEGQDVNQSIIDITNTGITHYTNIEALDQLFVHQNGTYISGSGTSIKWIIACNKLYKKQLFNNLRFPEGRIFEDEFITHRILYKCNKVTYYPARLYYYVQRNNSVLKSPFSVRKWDRVYALKDRVDFFKTIHCKKLYEKSLVSFMDAFFWCYLKSKSILQKDDYNLKPLKMLLARKIPALLRNQYLGRNQKILLCIFMLNTTVYDIYLKSKDREKIGA